MRNQTHHILVLSTHSPQWTNASIAPSLRLCFWVTFCWHSPRIGIVDPPCFTYLMVKKKVSTIEELVFDGKNRLSGWALVLWAQDNGTWYLHVPGYFLSLFDIYPWNAPIVDHVWIAVMSNECVMVPCVYQKKIHWCSFSTTGWTVVFVSQNFLKPTILTGHVSTPRLVDFFLFRLYYVILVGCLEHFLFFHILGIIIPTDELIFFRGVGIPPTRIWLPNIILYC